MGAAQEAEDLDVSLDGPAEAERAFGALSAAQFGAALAAYSAAQEREERGASCTWPSRARADLFFWL